MKQVNEIERSIIKKFRKDIWREFTKAVRDYELIEENDSIAVCISGGKDSFLLAKCLEELQKHGKVKFNLKYIVMDPGYNEKNRKQIEENIKKLNIDAIIYPSNIFEVIKKEHNPCYLCARMRRGFLYAKAKELGCNKIALGHHFNDVIETIMLNLIFTGQYSSMMPKLHSDNFEGMELIRPLYLVKEEAIIAWAKYNDLTFINCACQVTVKEDGQRKRIKELIKELKTIYDGADVSIFKSSENVVLNTIIGYKKDKIGHSFLENYKK